MTTPGTGWPREQFWLNTWRAWRSGTLAALLPGTVRDAAMDFQTFVSTCDAVQHPAFPVVLAGKALAPDEFLIGYDRLSGAAPSFLLTSTRLFIRQTKERTHIELPLDQITSFSDEGGIWTFDFHVSTADGRRWSFPKLDNVPKDAILKFAIANCRTVSAPIPHTTRDQSGPVVVSGESCTDVYVDTWRLALTGLAWPSICIACLSVGGLHERKLSIVLESQSTSLEHRTQYLDVTYSICASCDALRRKLSTRAYSVGLLRFGAPFFAALAALASGSWSLVIAGIAGTVLSFPMERWWTRRSAAMTVPVVPLNGVDWVQSAVLKGPARPGIERPVGFSSYTTHRVRFRFANADFAARFAAANQK